MLRAPPSLLPLLNCTPVCCRLSAGAKPPHTASVFLGALAGMADAPAAPLPRGSYFTEARRREILRTPTLRRSTKFGWPLSTPSGEPSPCRLGTHLRRCVPGNVPHALSPRAVSHTALTVERGLPTTSSSGQQSQRRSWPERGRQGCGC